MKTQPLSMLALFLGILMASHASNAFGQDTKEVLNQVLQVYSGSPMPNLGSSGGFSWWSLIGGTIFSGIGFIAFIYGKKNSAAAPMIIGILLMVYPFLVKPAWQVWLIGAGLTACLYFFRE